MTFIGVDGCQAGWIALALDAAGFESRLFASIPDLWDAWGGAARILIDIPIGLPSESRKARTFDKEARTLLGSPRRNSIFSPPWREALATPDDLLGALAGAASRPSGWSHRHLRGVALKPSREESWLAKDSAAMVS